MADTSAIEEKKELAQVVKQETAAAAAKEGKAAAAHSPEAKPAPVKEEGKKGEQKDAEKKEGKKEEKARKPILERLATIPLYKAYKAGSGHRGRVALSLIRTFAARHAKVAREQVSIAPAISVEVHERGSRKPPKRVKIMLKKFGDGKVSVESTVAVKAPRVKTPAKSTPKKAAGQKPAPARTSPSAAQKTAPAPAAVKAPVAQPVPAPLSLKQ